MCQEELRSVDGGGILKSLLEIALDFLEETINNPDGCKKSAESGFEAGMDSINL